MRQVADRGVQQWNPVHETAWYPGGVRTGTRTPTSLTPAKARLLGIAGQPPTTP
ncbi:hypothetical protein [Streptomyces sp. NRRL B-24484]|uniref:hypothetical protein n=1 Tax=Streptomyces sp. NRRL B-24484 TaxID=1463833 RepID=UPI000AC324C4|nr:hypothetical protein [Streptomyces sp. NRRL B-24484]